MSDKNNSIFVFLIGGIIGAAVGLLYAPKSGKETREDLRRMKGDLSDKVSDFTEDAKEKGYRIYEKGYEKILDGKDKLSEVLEEGKRVFKKYKDEDSEENDK